MDITLFDATGQRKYLTLAETARFLTEAMRLPPRERMFCFVLAYAGCRISEGLAICSAHVEAGLVTLRTLKRRKVIFRRVPVPVALSTALASLPAAENGLLFPMHRSTAFRLVKRVMLRAGIEGPHACPKGLRHGFGLRTAGAKVPANLVQRWLGHASFTTTAIYLDATGDEEQQFATLAWTSLPCFV